MTTGPEPALVDTNVLAQLAATMLGSSVIKIYTFNTADFQAFAFAGIQAMER